jgi:hypothetical protein
MNLSARAKQFSPRDPDVATCWGLVVRAVDVGWLDSDELRELISHLRDRRDYGVEELLFALGALRSAGGSRVCGIDGGAPYCWANNRTAGPTTHTASNERSVRARLGAVQDRTASNRCGAVREVRTASANGGTIQHGDESRLGQLGVARR